MKLKRLRLQALVTQNNKRELWSIRIFLSIRSLIVVNTEMMESCYSNSFRLRQPHMNLVLKRTFLRLLSKAIDFLLISYQYPIYKINCGSCHWSRVPFLSQTRCYRLFLIKLVGSQLFVNLPWASSLTPGLQHWERSNVKVGVHELKFFNSLSQVRGFESPCYLSVWEPTMLLWIYKKLGANIYDQSNALLASVSPQLHCYI